MSNTPETDHLEVQLGKAATHSHPILWEHSRKMERERDEARKERDQLKQLLAADSENVDAYLGVCIDRDEAREQAQRFRSLHYSHLGINASASWFPWEEKLGHE